LPEPPDLLELRLDHFWGKTGALEKSLPGLRVPLIITARHPGEGGANHLSLNQRRALLARFLPHARYLDVELRSARSLRELLARARKNNVGIIISFHDLESTPSVRSLEAKARAAIGRGADVFKVATRVDSPAQLQRLLDFLAGHGANIKVSAMGIGKLGLKSRRELMRGGSVLNYAHLGRRQIVGQPSLATLRRWLRGLQ
jgi:3-dehydroquinate dehydratase-1